jgi:colanic acid/amylovoran biosynthesis glycosyltransferase
MTITLVLPKPPAYSETFFQSKIKGLQQSGYNVIIATKASKQNFKKCEHVQHPKLVKNTMEQILRMLCAFIFLLPHTRRVINYIKLEQKENTNFKRIIEKIYLNATLLKLNTDWIHFGFATMAIDRELVAKAIGAKMGTSLRGYDVGVYPLKHPGCYFKLWKNVDKVHFNSYDLYDKALMLGLSTSRSALRITPALNVKLFKSVNVKHMQTKPVFITIGRLHWKKGYVLMLEALSEIHKKGIDFEYRIIGEGNDYHRIAYAAHQLKIFEKVHFLGKLKQKEVIANLELSDFCLQYSIQEGFCNTALEAQAMGKLCIVSDAEGLPENVIHGHTGWVVPRNQPQLLAKKIIEVIQMTQDEKSHFQKNAQLRVQNEFNLEKQAKSFSEFYLFDIKN